MNRSSFLRRRVGVSLAVALVGVGAIHQSSMVVSGQGAERANVLIRFASSPGPAEETLVRAAGGQLRHTYHLVPGIAASLPTQALVALANNPNVIAIEPDGTVEAYDAELDLTWGVARIGAGTAHGDGVTGAGVRVAVFDSGIEYTHYELSHAFAGGWDFVNDDGDPIDDNGHGTHVAGTIAAADDDSWVVGVAPGVQLFGIKILDALGQGDFSDVIAGLEWAADNGIQVANHSYGSSQNPGTLVELAFANATAAGVLNVAAAGNTGNCRGTGNNVGFPARYDVVIAVGATDQSDNRPCYSSTGPDVELAAPGDWIVSSYLNGDIAIGSGTSMASPHVAGTAALVMSAGIADITQVRNILTSTVEDLGASGRDKLFGFGLVNAAAAVEAAGPVPPAVHVALSTDKATYEDTDTAALLTVAVTDERGAPIGGLPYGNFLTTFDGIPMASSLVMFTEGGTPGVYTAALDISSAGSGDHSVTVEVIEGPLSGTDSAAFLIGSTPAPGTVKVSSIAYDSRGGSDGKRNIAITVTLEDGDLLPVAGASVSVWVYVSSVNGGLFPWAGGDGTTDAQGQVTFEAKNSPTGVYYTEVVAISAGGLVWDLVTPPNGFEK